MATRTISYAGQRAGLHPHGGREDQDNDPTITEAKRVARVPTPLSEAELRRQREQHLPLNQRSTSFDLDRQKVAYRNMSPAARQGLQDGTAEQDYIRGRNAAIPQKPKGALDAVTSAPVVGKVRPANQGGDVYDTGKGTKTLASRYGTGSSKPVGPIEAMARTSGPNASGDELRRMIAEGKSKGVPADRRMASRDTATPSPSSTAKPQPSLAERETAKRKAAAAQAKATADRDRESDFRSTGLMRDTRGWNDSMGKDERRVDAAARAKVYSPGYAKRIEQERNPSPIKPGDDDSPISQLVTKVQNEGRAKAAAAQAKSKARLVGIRQDEKRRAKTDAEIEATKRQLVDADPAVIKAARAAGEVVGPVIDTAGKVAADAGKGAYAGLKSLTVGDSDAREKAREKLRKLREGQ